MTATAPIADPVVRAEVLSAAALVTGRVDLLNGHLDTLRPELYPPGITRDAVRVATDLIREGGTCDHAALTYRLASEGVHARGVIDGELETLLELGSTVTENNIVAAAQVLTRNEVLDRRLAELHPTDLGNARRLVVRHGAALRFCKGIGWYAWDGRRWRKDDRGEVERRAKDTVRAIYREAATIADERARKALGDWARKSENATRIEKMIELAWSEPGIVVTVDELDADPWLLNVQNGVLELRTGTLRPHLRCDLMTKLAPVDFDPEAPCPTFDRFLDETVCGRADVGAYLQQFFGVCLTGDVSEQILPVWWGSGSNGKNTLVDPIMSILGDYAGKAAPDLLVAKRHGASHPTEIADLHGKRLVVASETEKGQRLRIQLVKELTGDQTLKGRYMRQDFFEFRRTHKTVLITNNKPRVQEETHAIWRRLQLVPFTNSVPADQQDKRLSEKLLAEAPGILAWMVRGCLSWQQEGLQIPGDVRLATDEYRAECDTIRQFAEECLTFAPELWVSSSNIATALQDWCREGGADANPADLRNLLRESDCVPKTTRSGRGWKGCGLLVGMEVPD